MNNIVSRQMCRQIKKRLEETGIYATIDEIQEHADASARGEKPDTVIAMAVEDYMNEIPESPPNHKQS